MSISFVMHVVGGKSYLFLVAPEAEIHPLRGGGGMGRGIVGRETRNTKENV